MVTVAVFLGLLASVLLVVLAAIHTRRLVIGVSVMLSMVVAAQYVVLGEFAAAGVSLVGLVFALAAVFVPHRKSVTVPVVTLMVVCLSVVSLLTGGIPVHPLGWFPLVGAVLMGFLPFVENVVWVKACQGAGGVVWGVFMVWVGAWGQVPGEVLYMVVWGVSVWRLYRQHTMNGVNVEHPINENVTTPRKKYGTIVVGS